MAIKKRLALPILFLLASLTAWGQELMSTAPTITTQPVNQTVTSGHTAPFLVIASGTTPLTYQWRKNGTNIGGATASNYLTPITTPADTGSVFSVVVTNGSGSATSSNAILTVTTSITSASINTPNTFTEQQDFFGRANFMGPTAIPSSSVASLPAASLKAGLLYEVTDGTSTGDCTVGGGTSNPLCMSNGVTWLAIGGSSSGVSGSGSVDTLPIWTDVTTLGNSHVAQNSSLNAVTITGFGLQVERGVTFLSRFSSYNGVQSVGNGMTQPVALINGTQFHGNYGPVTMFTTSASQQSNYRLSCYLVATIIAVTSSTLPACQVSWTDASTSVVETTTYSATNAGNTVGAYVSGSIFISPLNGTAIVISTTGYTSVSSGTNLNYIINFELERL